MKQKEKDKIGLVTYWNYNYGSVLQCYATQQIVEQKGYHCVLLYRKESGIMRVLYRMFDRLKGYRNYIRYPHYIRRFNALRASTRRKSSNMLSQPNIQKISDFLRNEIFAKACTYKQMRMEARHDQYLAYLSGSDQIWNGSWFVPNPVYFLRFAPSYKRIAWAPSFGTDRVAEYNTHIFSKYLSEYAFLSVRETQGVEIIKSLTGRDACRALDPTLILTADEWRDKVNKKCSLKLSEKPYILLFFLNEPCKAAVQSIEKLQMDTGMNVILLAYQYDALGKIVKLKHENCDPWAFLAYIDKASYVCTDSFHATAFSMQFSTPFFVFKRQYAHAEDQTGRVISLLELCGALDRFVENAELIDLNTRIDFEQIKKTLNTERGNALMYLDNALSGITKESKQEIPNGYRVKK